MTQLRLYIFDGLCYAWRGYVIKVDRDRGKRTVKTSYWKKLLITNLHLNLKLREKKTILVKSLEVMDAQSIRNKN